MSARNPIQVVELRQPRCSLRFGVGACPATGTPKCYNTFGTCPTAATKSALVADGRIRWRFVQNRPGSFWWGDFSDADDPATNGIPVASLQVSTAKAQANVAGVLDGKSPFGVHATCSVTMPDFVWSDHVGDFYLADRVDLPQRMFWACWTARNTFYGGMELLIYDGYEGDALADMRQRLYVLDNVSGPDAGGKVTLTGVSPLIEAESGLFPAAMDVKLVDDITASATTIRVATDREANLTDDYGIASYRGVVIGSEIILYSGYSEVTPGIYDIAVHQRGAKNTVAATAQRDARVQRIGWYENVPTWECGYDLLANHSPIGAAALASDWADEGDTYLPTLRSDTVITAPTKVGALMGEICQQGMFFTWWDEFQQQVRMQAVRPPLGPVTEIGIDAQIIAGSAVLRREPKSLLTRVFVYYDQRDPTKTEPSNYRVVNGRIETTNESRHAAGKPFTLEIKARWIKTNAHAEMLIARVLGRYRDVPRFLTIRVSGKDREITVGDVCDVTTRELIDSEGRFKSSRWQVISWDQIQQGEVYLLDMQTFDLVGRFGFWMADGSPDYTAATDEQKAMGAWWADDDGLMSTGEAGYQWQ